MVNRIGWKDDKTIAGFVLSAGNLTSASTRYFQEEHPAVTLLNIRDCQPVVKITNDDFNNYLLGMKKQAVNHVLSDVFERDYVNDELLDIYKTGFDNAILLRMVIVVSELIMTSTRSNKVERFTEEFVAKLNYDIYREAPNKFAIRDLNYKFSMGVTTRYGFEISSLQRRFGNQKNILRTATAGQANEEYQLKKL